MDKLAAMEKMLGYLSTGFYRESSVAFIDSMIAYADVLAADPLWHDATDVQQGIELLKALGAAHSCGADAALEETLAVEYAGLLLGVGANAVAPYESVYRGEDGILFEKFYFEVVEEYGQYGYSKPAWFQEPEDHIACELGFVGYLLQRARAAAGSGDADGQGAQRFLSAAEGFASRHLGRWVKAFCQDLLAACAADEGSTSYYPALAHLTLGYLEYAG
jgi:TorA maturation chaperone TorD